MKTLKTQSPENSLFSEENPEKNPEKNPEENPENIQIWPIIPTGDDHLEMNTRQYMYTSGEYS